VSPTDPYVRHHKRQTDRALGLAYRRLACDARALALLEAPVRNDRHPGVEALVRLARATGATVRTAASWPGSALSWQGAVHSLAQHLLCRYRVPAFLGAAWSAHDAFADAKREWFVAHGSGTPLRSLDLPVRLTRRMEHLLLGTHAHLGIEHALRRAELLGLGADPALAGAVLAAGPVTDLRHGPFWRTVWHFLIANTGAIALDQVAPIVDFLHAVRHEHVPLETPDGVVLRPPPQPDFSLRGRTPASVLRLMDEWHRQIGIGDGELRWERSRLHPLAIEVAAPEPDAPPVVWELAELTNSSELRAEGAALRHCVPYYAHACWRGRSRIWSVRRRRGASVRPVVTVEVDPQRRTIVQARGFRNRLAAGKSLELLRTWAAREGLRIASL
jgi:hypothetical protein